MVLVDGVAQGWVSGCEQVVMTGVVGGVIKMSRKKTAGMFRVSKNSTTFAAVIANLAQLVEQRIRNA